MKLKYFRISKDMTLDVLSKETGFSEGHLSHLENETRAPSKEAMEKIAAAIGETVQDIFFTELTEEEETVVKNYRPAKVVQPNGVS